jgi:hypothetical protein
MNRIFAVVFVLTSAAIVAAGTVSAEPADVSCNVLFKSHEFSALIEDGTGDLPLWNAFTLHVDVDFDTKIDGEDAISLVPRLLAPDGTALQEQQALHLWASPEGDRVGIRSTVRHCNTDLSYVIACRKLD